MIFEETPEKVIEEICGRLSALGSFKLISEENHLKRKAWVVNAPWDLARLMGRCVAVAEGCICRMHGANHDGSGLIGRKVPFYTKLFDK